MRTQLKGTIDDKSLGKELKTCKHFFVDSEVENARHKYRSFATETLDPKPLLEKLDAVCQCAGILIVAFGLVLRNVKYWSFRWYYARNKTLLERSKLVATMEDLSKIQNLLSDSNVIESCTSEGTSTKWKFYKLTKDTFFAAKLLEVPMDFRDAVLPDPPTKKRFF